MKVILNESRFDSIFSDWLEKSGIDIYLGWFGSNKTFGNENIIGGLVKLSEDDVSIGNSHGYIFSFILGDDGELTYKEVNPDFGKIGIFQIFPTELVIKYFSELIKEYLYNDLK
jgi:hypothetical protein